MNPVRVTPGWLQAKHGRLRTYHSNRGNRIDGPLIVILPGLTREVGSTGLWLDTCGGAYESLLIELPGQGGSDPIPAPALADLVDAIRAALMQLGARKLVIVGESLGGLVALSLGADPPPNLIAVISADPPLRPARRPSFEADIRAIMLRQATDQLLRAVPIGALGIRAESTIASADHYHLLTRARVPTLVVTGDDAHNDSPVGKRYPRVLDHGTLAEISATPPANVSVAVVPRAGHMVLTDAPTECFALLQHHLTQASAGGTASA